MKAAFFTLVKQPFSFILTDSLVSYVDKELGNKTDNKTNCI